MNQWVLVTCYGGTILRGTAGECLVYLCNHNEVAITCIDAKCFTIWTEERFNDPE